MTIFTSRKFVSLRRRAESGVALITVLLVLLIASALAVALMYIVNSEQKLQSNDAQGGIAYYGAEAGMEKMMADLMAIFPTANNSPTPAQIASVACPNGTSSCSNQPDPGTLNGTTFSEYAIDVPLAANGTDPAYQQRTITSGTNAGLVAQVLPLTLSVTASQPGGQQVRMIRNVEVALIPVFQFGVFSDSDLDFFPGTNFSFGGRTQTNQNLFLAAGSGNNLVFTGPVRANFDVIRDTLENGVALSASGHTGSVYIPTAPNACDAFVQSGMSGTPSGTCQALTLVPDQGSVTGGAMAPTTEPAFSSSVQPNSQWTTIQRAYGSQLENGGASGSGPGTGASPLTLTFVAPQTATQPAVTAIELIRRPQPSDNQTLSNSRLFNKAQIRILLSDSPADLPGGSADSENIQLVNDSSNSPGRCFKNANYLPCLAEEDPTLDGDWTGYGVAGSHSPGCCTNLIGGWLRVEYRDSSGAYHGITDQWLSLGVTRMQAITDSEHNVPANPNGNWDPLGQNSILVLQQQRCFISSTNITTCVWPSGSAPMFQHGGEEATNFMPINIYDTREGNYRDVDDGNCRVGGVMNLVDIDVKNLSAWIAANAGNIDQSQNGYILYFSDRRGMLPDADAASNKIGEYGFTDVINEANADGAPNGIAEQGELLDPAGKVETWGGSNLGEGFTTSGSPEPSPFQPLSKIPTQTSTPPSLAACMVGAKNYVSGARHGVRLINGSLGNLPKRPNPIGANDSAFTFVSENPVYVMGNYNANDSGFGDPHASAAVIADGVTFLSRNWNDLQGFLRPTSIGSRAATSGSYRLAILSGKNQPFALASVPNLSCTNSSGGGGGACPQNGQSAALPYHDFGTDGGIHNFLRLLEGWNGVTLNYSGSLVSLYFSYYGTGVYKCCTSVFGPPTRNYSFDTDFQTPATEPPGTPQFEDVVNIGFRQDFSNIGH